MECASVLVKIRHGQDRLETWMDRQFNIHQLSRLLVFFGVFLLRRAVGADPENLVVIMKGKKIKRGEILNPPFIMHVISHNENPALDFGVRLLLAPCCSP